METQDEMGSGLEALTAAGSGRVHLVGICGVGMAGVAVLLRARGFEVSGCDAAPGRLAGWLAARGIACASGHDPAHVAAADWLVRTAAVPAEHPEIAAAAARGKPVFTRGAVLAALIGSRTSIAVSGTHGKTTTSSFIARVLHDAGRYPSWCIGGEVAPERDMGVAEWTQGEFLVVEADESDGSVAGYRPDIAVVTNVEYDHMEHFADADAFMSCFRTFVRQARRCVIYCADDPGARNVAAAAAARAISYGFAPDAAVRGELQADAADAPRVAVSFQGQPLGIVRLPVPGDHNIRNALACIAVLLELGLPFDAIAKGLSRIGLPRRRFETIPGTGAVRVISDYAHHPTEIRALVRTARSLAPRRLLAVFQPHRYTRTLALGTDFPAAFAGVDRLVLTPVYAASEVPLAGGTAADLYARFRSAAEAGVPAPILAPSLDSAWWRLAREARAGDWLLIVGAGDIEELTERAQRDGAALGGGADRRAARVAAFRAAGVSEQTSIRCDEPLAGKTTLGVGGEAEFWVEVASEADLRALLAVCAGQGIPFRILGAGSNVLVSDLGAPGVTARLTGPAFRDIRVENKTLVAGAGVALGRLLQFAEDAGWGGLEFLEGIPATVGGALRMNAGAWGEAIGDRVAWIRALNRMGTPCIVHQQDLISEYRRLKGIEDCTVLEAGFALTQDARAAIRARRAACADRRQGWAGLRCAGSVFRNPAGTAAGRLCEAAGLKGCTVGGASVWEGHANVIVTAPGATGSDVAALMAIMQDRVRHGTGIALEPEMVMWSP